MRLTRISWQPYMLRYKMQLIILNQQLHEAHCKTIIFTQLNVIYRVQLAKQQKLVITVTLLWDVGAMDRLKCIWMTSQCGTALLLHPISFSPTKKVRFQYFNHMQVQLSIISSTDLCIFRSLAVINRCFIKQTAGSELL